MEASAIKIKIAPSLSISGSREVHDELYSRILLIRNKKTMSCIINFDLLNTDKETTDRICSLIEERAGELFVEYRIEIKKRSSSPFTFVVTLANDDIGYMPTETAFKLGGYQTWPLWFYEYPAPSVGRTLVEESLNLIKTCAVTEAERD